MAAATFWGCDRGDPVVERDGLASALVIEGVDPPPESREVSRALVLRLRFDRPLRPDSVTRQSVQITGGTFDPDGGPLAGVAFVEPFYDAVERVAVFTLQPGVSLSPTDRYTVTLGRYGVADDGTVTPGFVGYDGSTLAAPLRFGLTTAAASPSSSSVSAPAKADYCGRCVDGKLVVGARQILNESCGSCHGTKDPEMGLVLTTSEGLARTAVARPAHETLTGPTTLGAPTNPPVFGKSMPVVDPGGPGNSYLLFKLLDRPEAFAPASPAFPYASPAAEPVRGPTAPSNATLEALRESFVLGGPMPPSGPIGVERARILQAWVSAGATLVEDAACPDLSACL